MKPRVSRIVALLLMACALPESALAITYKPSAVTFVHEGTQRIYVFARGDNGHLVLNFWNGTTWQWSDRGLPSGVSSIAQPSAISYVDGAGQRRIYAFVATSKGGLAVHYWNGSQWQWAHQGIPSGATELHIPTAITYVDPAGNRRIYAFCVDYWGGMFVNYWNGSSWQWSYLGGDGSPVDFSELDLSAITYVENGTRKIRVFRSYLLLGLSATFWDGANWQSEDHGGAYPSGVSAISYEDTVGNERIYAFVTSYYKDPFDLRYFQFPFWSWSALGSPPSQPHLRNPSAVTYVDDQGHRRMYAFTRGEDNGRLYVKYFVDANQYWADQGLAPGGGISHGPSAITYMDSAGQRRIYAFARASNGHLVVNYWNGTSWQWADQGTL